MPDTASDLARPTASRRRPRLTLRLRLTLLYGACFIVAGAVLLAITYGLVAQSTGTARATFAAHGAVRSGPGPGVAGTTTLTQSAGSGSGALKLNAATAVTPSRAQLAEVRQIQASGQRQIKLLVTQAQFAIKQQHNRTLQTLLTRSGIALAIMALLAIGIGYLLAGRTLAPLRVMNLRTRAITEDTLHERLDLGRRSDEMGQLASSFDALLARLERAFAAQRRFVANASHELRTPVTLERALVEVALADPQATVESLRGTCQRVLAATEHQERIIDALLTLARSQTGIERSESVDLAELLAAGLDARTSTLSGLELDVALAPALVQGDRALLERLVANLLDNAVRHNAQTAAWITVSTEIVSGRAQLRIANAGPLVAAEQAHELFEPFRRLDGERTSGGGLGLGLSIVKAIVDAHGGDIEASPLPEGGLEFRLTFPSAALGECTPAEAASLEPAVS